MDSTRQVIDQATAGEPSSWNSVPTGEGNSRLRLWGRQAAIVAGMLALVLVAGMIYCGSLSAFWQFLGGRAVAVEPSVVHLGTQRVGKVTHVNVGLRNMGWKPLTVVGAHSTCSCVGLRGPLPLTIGPRKAGPLEFVVVPTGSQAGKAFESETQLFLDTKSVPIVIHFDGDVEPAGGQEKS